MQRLILFFLISLTSHSFAENTVRLYCFQGENLQKISAYLRPILKKKDRVSAIESSNCLEVHLSSIRIPLFDSWLSRRYKFKNDFTGSTISSNSRSLSECRLELIKKSNQNSQKNSTNLGTDTDIKIQKTSALMTSRSRFLMTSGKPFSFQVNDQSTFITCYNSSDAIYKLSISLSSSKGGVATSITLNKGQEVNIGSIVDELNQNDKNIDIKNGLSIKKTKSKQTSNYSLKIY